MEAIGLLVLQFVFTGFHRADREGHWLNVVLKVDSHFMILINVYGHKSVTQNRQMLENIITAIAELKTLHPTDFILMRGDWNMTPDECEDRWPPKFDSHHYNSLMEDSSEIIT